MPQWVQTIIGSVETLNILSHLSCTRLESASQCASESPIRIVMSGAPKEPNTLKRPLLVTAESLAILQEQQVQSHSYDVASTLGDAGSVSLRLSLRRCRIALLIIAVVTAVAALTLIFSHGTELERFDRNDVSPEEQKELLDRYNSYSGNAASALGRPLEVIVALTIQVVVLWVMADTVLTAKTSWRLKLTTLALGAGVGFLLTNAFNALNVQVQELPVHVVMSTSDLSVQVNLTGSSTTDASFSESSVGNPSTNTILRDLILPRAARKEIKCSPGVFMDDDSVAFGIPQRAWMKDMIPEALPTKTMRFDLKANKTNKSLDVADFPINATAAADLLIAGVYTGTVYAPWSAAHAFVNGNSSVKAYPTSAAQPRCDAPTARLAGLLPPDQASSETQDRKWFIDRSTAFVRAAMDSNWQNSSLVNWTMDVSRVNITSSVWVEAITLESEMIPTYLSKTTFKGTQYFPQTTHRSSSPVHMFVPRGGQDSEALLHAYAVCLNNNSTETIHSTLEHDKLLSESTIVCANKSTTSLYFFSTGRRLVADALLENTMVNASGIFPGDGTMATNLRIVYSTTFARIRWELQDLSKPYGASCQDDDGKCMGLDAELSRSSQRLLLSARALPIDQVPLITLQARTYIPPAQLPLFIASVRRPTTIEYIKYPQYLYGVYFGDVLLPHNIRNVSVDTTRVLSGKDCDLALDGRLQDYVNNHMYMETTLQATYTAAAFFLFQNAVAKDVVEQSASVVTLDLDQNVQEMSVWLSVPRQNAILTLIGCGLLIAALIVVLIRHEVTTSALDSPQHVTTPHLIARVMVDDTTFPSLLLKRHVNFKEIEGDADQFLIRSLSLNLVNLEDTSDEV